jgi:hypothetical protein
MNTRRAAPRRLGALVLGTALVASLASAPATSAAPSSSAPGNDCPDVMPVADVTAGMVGTGYTVSRGTTPEPFDAEILGVYPDAILPGRDLIMAEVHSPAIDAVKGVWFGMSGSPVYVTEGGTDKLVGAVAWGFSFGPSHVIGLTAAEDMVDILDYGMTVSSSARTSPSRIRLTDRMRRTVAQASESTLAEVPGTLAQLKMPVSVSGVSGPGSKRALTRMQRHLNRRGASVRLYAGASADSTAAAAPSDLVPGSNFAAALSYGDLTFAGIGTTTFQCNGFAVAFGHPFFFEGKTTIGANAATALTIYPDPVFSPFKLATVGANVGTVDQDRIAGIRADFSQPIPTTPIDSTTVAENTGRTQQGHTDVVLSDEVPFLAPYHEYLQVIGTMDQYSEGSGEVSWTVTGTKSDGTPWELHRSNKVSSEYDIPYETVHEMDHMMWRLVSQNFEEIDFTGVEFEQVTVRDEVRQYAVSKVLVSVNGKPYEKARRIRVRPGARLALRVRLNPYDESLSTRTVELRVRVPRDARRDGVLRVFGGPGHHTGIVGKASSFENLLDKMNRDPVNNSLGASLRIGRRARDTDRLRLDTVVVGGRSIQVRIKGGTKGGGAG